MQALLFDCDGVLVDTERDGHRVAFNRAFAQKGFSIEWDENLYGQLLKVGGGKERMRHYFNTNGWPASLDTSQDNLIQDLHKLKTDLFMQIIENGELTLRPGVARLIDEAIEADIVLAVCSTSNERTVNYIVETLLGASRKHISGIFAGDMAKKKKPHPEIYLLAQKQLNLDPDQCIVVEDSRNGLLAAKAAAMRCIITTNGYTKNEDFSEAELIVPQLGDPPNVNVDLNRLINLSSKELQN